MPMTGRRIVCEVCGLGFSAEEWRQNMGYCMNCDQPYGPNARGILDLPRADVDPLPDTPVAEDIPPLQEEEQ